MTKSPELKSTPAELGLVAGEGYTSCIVTAGYACLTVITHYDEEHSSIVWPRGHTILLPAGARVIVVGRDRTRYYVNDYRDRPGHTGGVRVR